MFLHSLINVLRGRSRTKEPGPSTPARLRLERLEDRVVPSAVINTYTNATVQITPGLLVSERVTATVTPFQGFDPSTGQITPIPAGATAPAGGAIFFNLNNWQHMTTLNANGQATFTFTLPLLTFLAGQTLTLSYTGFDDTSSGESWQGSTFVAPLYKNFDNVFLPGTLTFTQLPPEMVYAEAISQFDEKSLTPVVLTPYYTAQGETDSVLGGLLAFDYVDAGAITSVTVLGIHLPGIFALNLNAYGGFSPPSPTAPGS